MSGGNGKSELPQKITSDVTEEDVEEMNVRALNAYTGKPDKQQLINDFHNFIQNVHAMDTPQSVVDNKDPFMQAKTNQINLLSSKFMQSKLIRALQADDMRDYATEELKEKLASMSPRALGYLINQLAETNQVEFMQIFGGGAGKKGEQQQGPLVNLNITGGSVVASQDGGEGIIADGSQDSAMRAMRSLAKIFDNVVSNVREAEFEKIDKENKETSQEVVQETT